MPYIVVDAGHGGWDKGAHFSGYNEKDITLRVATKVCNRLREIGFKVTQLRTDDTYIGNLVLNKEGKVEFRPSSDLPIRDFPLKDNKAKGAIEIFQMPEKNREGKVYSNRYIIGHDPVDND